MNPEISNNTPKHIPDQNQKGTNAGPRKENLLREIVKFTLIALVIVIPIRFYVAQPFIVDGASMDPTFATGQYLIVDQLTYHFEQPQREDVIIFRYPNNPSIFYIKRIIGLPGETVTMKNGIVTIINTANPKGFILPDPHVSPANLISADPNYNNFTITLGPTEYFVMGDNRAESSDSRAWGPLEDKYIVGRPLIRLYPLNEISLFPGQ